MGRSGLSLPSSPMSNVPARIIGMAWRSPDSIILIHLDSAAASFGNWMNQNDRQTSLNMGFEALKDLASALKISDKDIAYQGTLAIAFGARGSGQMLRLIMNLCVQSSILRKCTGPVRWHMNGGMDLTIILVQRWAQKGCCQNSPASMRRSKNSLTP